MLAGVFAGDQTVLLGEEDRGGKNAVEFASRDPEIAGLTGSGCDNHGIEFPFQVRSGNVHADVDSHFKSDSFRFKQSDSPVDDGLVEFEIGDSVAEESTRTLITLVDRDQMTRLIQQRRRRKSGRTRSDDSNRFPAPFCHRTNFHQSVGERLLHDVAFDLADGHRFKIESAGAGPLAERRTDPRCEFREAACRREQIPRLLHPAVCNRLVELRNLVPERTACSMAERDAAVHAALRLLLQDFRRRRNFHFAEIVNTFFNRAIGMRPAFQIIKCAFLILSHDQSPPSLNCCV